MRRMDIMVVRNRKGWLGEKRFVEAYNFRVIA